MGSLNCMPSKRTNWVYEPGRWACGSRSTKSSPVANLTASFLTDEEVEKLWTDTHRRTVYGALEPLFGNVSAG
jgi:hypothetical protein